MSAPFDLREATAADAEAIAALHTDSWQRTYRGMMPDAFLDGGALGDRRRVWRERLGGVYLWVMEANAPARAFYDRLGARNVEIVQMSDPGGGNAPNCRYVWPDASVLL